MLPNLTRCQQLFHTVRHLRPVQISNRLRRRFFPAQFTALESLPVRPPTGAWVAGADRAPSLLDAHTLRVFQHQIALDTARQWNAPELNHLVQYNLHYFDDLASTNSDQRSAWHRVLIDRWIAENPPGIGVGWEPYPLSLRIVNWIKWQLGGQPLAEHQRASLATQTAALTELLEYHLLANHLLANAKALVFAGAFFKGERATEWLRQGSRIMQAEIAEQILPDGGHFELSPMYHSIILEDLLDLCNLARVYPECPELAWISRLEPRIATMRRWLEVMTHPDGQISFFNDAAWGIAPLPADLERYAERLGQRPLPSLDDGVHPLLDSGYVRLQRGAAVLLVDAAEVGPTYQPGHAHADTLSYELSLFGQRLIVNSGTSCYGLSAERLRQRSTAAHSTVEVDGANSSEVWSGFRVARRARPIGLQLETVGDSWSVRCGHTGYRRLPGKVTIWRTWRLQANALEIRDELSGRFKRAVARHHCHPAWTVTRQEPASPPSVRPHAETAPPLSWHCQLVCPAGQATLTAQAPRLALSPGSYHPQFELGLPNTRIEVDAPPGGVIEQRFHW